MSSRGPYRRHSPQFKLQLCNDIRSGTLGRREAQKTYRLSANLIQLWLTQFDRGELNAEEVEADLVVEYESRIAALERKIGQLTMELELCKKRRVHQPPMGTRSYPSSPARRMFHPKGVPSDRATAQHVLLLLRRASP